MTGNGNDYTIGNGYHPPSRNGKVLNIYSNNDIVNVFLNDTTMNLPESGYGLAAIRVGARGSSKRNFWNLLTP